MFAEAQIYGRLAGLHMQHLGRWEHAIGETAVDEDLKTSLEFVRDRVICGRPRVVDANPGRVFHLYTDACYENLCGGVGGVLFDESGTMLSYFSAQISQNQVMRLNPLRKDTIIFELEALAAWLGGYFLLQSAAVCPNDRVVVFLDNDGMGVLSQGTCLVRKISFSCQYCRPTFSWGTYWLPQGAEGRA